MKNYMICPTLDGWMLFSEDGVIAESDSYVRIAGLRHTLFMLELDTFSKHGEPLPRVIDSEKALRKEGFVDDQS